MRIWMKLRRRAQGAWWGFRQIMGDAAYDRYLMSRAGSGSRQACKVLSREEFYLDQLRRRYSGVSRCC